MSPNEIAGLVGAAFAGAAGTGAIFVRYVWPLLKKGEADRLAIKSEVGVGEGPRLHETVSAMASTLGRVDQRLIDTDRRWSADVGNLRAAHQGIHHRIDRHEERHVTIDATINDHGVRLADLSWKQDALAKIVQVHERKQDLGPPPGMAERREKV